MYNLIYEAQKHRAINRDQESSNLIEIDPDIAKKIEQVLQLPSNSAKLIIMSYREARKGSTSTQGKKQRITKKKTRNEAYCRFQKYFRYRQERWRGAQRLSEPSIQ